MGGAQPLAASLAGAVSLNVEIDPHRIERRLETRYLDEVADDLDDALRRVRRAADARQGVSIGLLGNAGDVFPELARRGEHFDLVTDQTSAHDMLNGYVPRGMTYDAALELRAADADEYVRRAQATAVAHVEAMVAFKDAGSHVFDYGNNLRTEAKDAGYERAFDFPGFVPAYVRPLFCRGAGPVPLGGPLRRPGRHRPHRPGADRGVPRRRLLQRWLASRRERIAFQGLPSRICWLGQGDAPRAGRCSTISSPAARCPRRS